MSVEQSVRHHTYIELLDISARLDSVISASIGAIRTVEVFADITPIGFSTTQVAEAIVGSYGVLGWFEYDAPTTNSTSLAPLRFVSPRNAVYKVSADGEIQLGHRTVLRGLDDGVNVYAWQDGVPLGAATSQADWTTAQAAREITFGSPLYIGYDDSVAKYTRLRLHEFWMKVNGTIIVHWRPESEDAVTIPDLSEYGHDARIGAAAAAGVEGTDYVIRSSLNEEVGL